METLVRFSDQMPWQDLCSRYFVLAVGRRMILRGLGERWGDDGCRGAVEGQTEAKKAGVGVSLQFAALMAEWDEGGRHMAPGGKTKS